MLLMLTFMSADRQNGVAALILTALFCVQITTQSCTALFPLLFVCPKCVHLHDVVAFWWVVAWSPGPYSYTIGLGQVSGVLRCAGMCRA
jgi:hypothetical protein